MTNFISNGKTAVVPHITHLLCKGIFQLHGLHKLIVSKRCSINVPLLAISRKNGYFYGISFTDRLIDLGVKSESQRFISISNGWVYDYVEHGFTLTEFAYNSLVNKSTSLSPFEIDICYKSRKTRLLHFPLVRGLVFLPVISFAWSHILANAVTNNNCLPQIGTSDDKNS